MTAAQPLGTTLIQYEQSWGSRKEVIKKKKKITRRKHQGPCTLFSPGGAVETETAQERGKMTALLPKYFPNRGKLKWRGTMSFPFHIASEEAVSIPLSGGTISQVILQQVPP